MTQPDNIAIATRRIAKARTRLLLRREFVFWATCALHLKPISAPGLGTCGVDGKHLYFDPDLIASDHWDDEELMFVIAHEVSHCAKGDTWRRGAREPERWNIACDMRINPELVKAGLKQPPKALGDASHFGRAAEEIYASLPPSQNGGQGQGQAGASGPGNKPGQPNGNFGNCGAVWDAGGNEPTQAQRNAAAQAAAKQWEIIARQAANIAKAQGYLPAGYEHLVEPVRPHLDPYAMLRHFVSMCRRDDFSWARGNRRYLHSGLYLPSLWSEGVGEILIAGDVSGSTTSIWPKIAGFLNSVLTEVKPEKTWFLQVDAAVQSAVEYGPGEELPTRFNIRGGGGTDMRPIWEWAAEHSVEPVCAIVVSDMEMGKQYFGPPGGPGYPTLWISSTEGAEAPFGETVEMLE